MSPAVRAASMSALEYLHQGKLGGGVMEVLKDLEDLLAGVEFETERDTLHRCCDDRPDGLDMFKRLVRATGFHLDQGMIRT